MGRIGQHHARDRKPDLSLQLAADNFTLDPFLDRFVSAASSGGQGFLDALLVSQPPEWMNGNVEIETGTLTVRDVLVRGMRLDARLEDGHIDIAEAKGELGGSTGVGIRGKVSPAWRRGPVSRRTASVMSANIAALAYWLSPPGDPEEGGRATPRGRPFAARAKLRLEPGVTELNDLAMDYASDLAPRPALWAAISPVEMGKIAPASAEGSMSGSLSIVDPLISLLPPATDDPFRFFNAHDVALTLKADRLSLFGQEMKDVETEMSLEGGNLDVRASISATLQVPRSPFRASWTMSRPAIRKM